MDAAKQLQELAVLVNRAKRAGIIVHDYPENHVVILRVIPPPAPVSPPAEATAKPAGS